MKAAIFNGPHKPVAVESEVEIDAPRDDEVVVRTVATGVCHSELHFLDGSSAIAFPSILGHEAAGVIERAGSRVTSVKPGDHVITRSSYCGHCRECLTGHLNRCTARPGRSASDKPRWTLRGKALEPWGSNISSWAERMLLHESAVVKIREDMSLEAASLLGCAVITGFGAVTHSAQVPQGATVAVFGCGGIGLSAVQGAALSGARRIIAVDLLDSKLEAAARFGATDGVNAAKEDPVAAIHRITDGGADYSFDAIGKAKVAVQAIDCLGPGGLATLIGVVAEGEMIELSWRQLSNGEKRVQGCMMGSNRFPIDYPMLVDMYMQGRLKLDEMISRRGHIEEINDMCEVLKGGDVLRQIIVFEN